MCESNDSGRGRGDGRGGGAGGGAFGGGRGERGGGGDRGRGGARVKRDRQQLEMLVQEGLHAPVVLRLDAQELPSAENEQCGPPGC